jgi:succinoglycan biosynthesis protein ExoO
MTASDLSDLDSGRPVVSVIIANYDGAAYLTDAIQSAQRQTLRDLEIIISDDGSKDASVGIVTRLMAEDRRIRLIQSKHNRGPAAARNSALAVAKGEWIAVMDSDDLIHSERLIRLVEAARRDGAELAADNILEVYQDRSVPPRPLLRGEWAVRPHWIGIIDYIKLNLFYKRGPNLGYLKPLFRASILAETNRYDETLTIGEDYDLVARLLQSGKKLRVYPDALYFYRKHRASLSQRPNTNALEALRAANQRFLKQISPRDPKLVAAINTRTRSIDTALLYHKLLDCLKAGEWSNSLRIALRKPQTAALLRIPIGARLRRLLPSVL